MRYAIKKTDLSLADYETLKGKINNANNIRITDLGKSLLIDLPSEHTAKDVMMLLPNGRDITDILE